ncbi:hypothetical protein TKK_0013441 [Trichogramma kaykai]|uniref:Kinetochore protein Spc24 n=1 Tax=Trichogramma kaykai TaxID=54128 RepID=A0ABD2WIM3_9HYME
MEDILALPAVNGPDEVLDILNKISNTRLADEKFSHKVEEYESKICEISKEVKALKNAVDSEQQVLDSKIAEFEDYNNLLMNLKRDHDIKQAEVDLLSRKRNKLENATLSLKDQQLITTGKRKLELYKSFTGVRWDYSCTNSIEGFITNKKDYIKKFCFKNNEDYKTIREQLWEYIRESTDGYKW